MMILDACFDFPRNDESPGSTLPDDKGLGDSSQQTPGASREVSHPLWSFPPTQKIEGALKY
jgi:hypothetical protein